MNSHHSDSDGPNDDLETHVKDSVKHAQPGLGMGDNVNAGNIDVDNANSTDLAANTISWDKIDGKSSNNNIEDNLDNQSLNIDEANKLRSTAKEENNQNHVIHCTNASPKKIILDEAGSKQSAQLHRGLALIAENHVSRRDALVNSK